MIVGDLLGKVINGWRVIKRARRHDRHAWWELECPRCHRTQVRCGTRIRYALKRDPWYTPRCPHCPPARSSLIDMSGKVVGPWFVGERAGSAQRSGNAVWRASCLHCQHQTTVEGPALRDRRNTRCPKCRAR